MDKKTFEQKIWNIVYSDDGNEKRLIDLLWDEIKPDPKAIQVQAKVMPKIAEIIDEMIQPLSKQPYLTGHDLETKEDKWNISIRQSESYGAYKKLLELKEKLSNFTA